ncbi:hypothetical protein Tco_1407342 [Tanacetum coccineum]
MARLLISKVARWWELDIPDLLSYEDWLDWFNSLRLLKGVKDILEGIMLCGGSSGISVISLCLEALNRLVVATDNLDNSKEKWFNLS